MERVLEVIFPDVSTEETESFDNSYERNHHDVAVPLYVAVFEFVPKYVSTSDSDNKNSDSVADPLPTDMVSPLVSTLII